MTTTFRHVVYSDPVPTNTICVLVGDIGGTNANFAFFAVNQTSATILFSLHAKSQEITDFTQVVIDVLAYAQATYDITATNACFAAAGVIYEERTMCKPTNASFTITTEDIKAQTNLHCVFLVNDFEVIGYGLASLDPKKLVKVRKGTIYPHANQAILGAGTGLGKCTMTWIKTVDRHIPVASEGGHADFAAQDQLEYDLTAYIRTTEDWGCNVSWEDVLSGNGIKRLYNFFRARNHKDPANHDLRINGLHPDTIFKNRFADPHAHNTFMLYTKLYARCAKNFALDALALGGVYIAGGIAANNLALFEQRAFAQEFVNCGKQQALLTDIPIFVIIDYNVSLYGVVHYMILERMCT